MHEFDYIAPRSLEELDELLAKNGSRARVLAGGTDLIVKMRSGDVRPALVIDVKSIPELSRIELSAGGLKIGAAVSCRALHGRADVCKAYPMLVEAASLVGGVQNQGRATIGGNICNAAPSADLLPALIALGAVVAVRSRRGQREQALEELCTGPGCTTIGPDEALARISLPPSPPRSGSSFLRFTPRNEMDIAVASAAVSVVLDEDGQSFRSARIALGAVGPVPVLATRAGDFLGRSEVSDDSIRAAATLASEAALPIDDMRGSARQRSHLVEVLVRRTLSEAIRRARGGAG